MKMKVRPCSYTRISQKYSPKHRGIDLAAPKGTPVYAVADGTVAAASYGAWDDSYGNMVAIYHGSDYTNYAHLSKINVKKGRRVKAGQKIGEVGSTGNSTGNHLHFEEHRGRKWNRVDPLPDMNNVGEYRIGATYTLRVNLKVRTGAGSSYRQKKRKELTAYGKRHSFNREMAVLKKDTRVTCQAIRGSWMRISSGWICCKSGSKVYVS